MESRARSPNKRKKQKAAFSKMFLLKTKYVITKLIHNKLYKKK